MNKTRQLISIIDEFTLAFCQRFGLKPSEAKFFTTAGSDLAELQARFEDFLEENDLEYWPEYSLKLRRVRGIAFRPFATFEMYKPFLSSPEWAANAVICLIKQTQAWLEQERPVKRDFAATNASL